MGNLMFYFVTKPHTKPERVTFIIDRVNKIALGKSKDTRYEFVKLEWGWKPNKEFPYPIFDSEEEMNNISKLDDVQFYLKFCSDFLNRANNIYDWDKKLTQNEIFKLRGLGNGKSLSENS
jgi:hypothetical protein